MTITLKYLAQLRHVAGVGSEPVELAKPCSVKELIQRVAQRRGEPLRRWLINEAGTLQPTILLFLGDVQVTGQEDVELNDGDVITLLSPIAGG